MSIAAVSAERGMELASIAERHCARKRHGKGELRMKEMTVNLFILAVSIVAGFVIGWLIAKFAAKIGEKKRHGRL